MNLNKNMIIILVLTSLLISAIGSAIYLFMDRENSKNLNNELITVFIAKSFIKQNSIVKESDIKSTQIAKKYLLTMPMLKKEIINKIAKTDIYKNEMFRKAKLTTKIDKEESAILDFIYNSCNISFELFENPNFNLAKGEYINIISVYPAKIGKTNLDYNVNYVAKSIRVLGFLEKGKPLEATFRKQKKMVKDKKTKKSRSVVKTYYADELLLDIKNDVLLRLIDDYNKGKQLWMVKTRANKKIVSTTKKDKLVDDTVSNSKLNKKELNDLNSVIKNSKVNDKKSVDKSKIKRDYPKVWYQPRPTKLTQKAMIYYSDNKDATKTYKNSVEIDYEQECLNNRDKILIGISNKVHLRAVASFKGKVKRILKRNYLIPYTNQVDDNWYETCDKKYVHKNEARPYPISKLQNELRQSR